MKTKGEEVHESLPRLEVTGAGARVPRLRFPEFGAAEEWEEKRLGDICERITQGGTPDTAIQEYWNGPINWLTPAEMNSNDRSFIFSTTRKLTKLGLENCSSELLPVDSVILSTRAPIGHLAINKSPMAINQGCKGLIPNHATDFLFLFYSLFAKKRALIDLGAGNTFKELSGSSLKELMIPISKKGEQHKIADCLSSLDELIEAHGFKLEALKTYKKSLMQGLFPVEGERVPRLRFPEFRNEGEWEEEKAGDLFANRIENGIEGLPIYSVTTNDGMVRRSEIDRNFYDIEDPEGNKRACKHDIAYNMMRMWQGALGVAAEDCLVSPAYVILKPREDVCSEFYYYLLKTERYLLQLMSHSQGLTLDRLRLYYKDFAKISLPYPQLPEQRKIAATLSLLEKLIASEAQQLGVLKEHKKGLMQGLFPAGETDR